MAFQKNQDGKNAEQEQWLPQGEDVKRSASGDVMKRSGNENCGAKRRSHVAMS